jgi:prepilin-type N-terminal cleavage/methylation domain-containing protein
MTTTRHRSSNEPFGRGTSRVHSRWAHRARRDDEKGFTLIELVIVTAVLPLIVGGLAVGLLSVFSLQSGVANRLSQTSDAQMVSSNFENDVQSSVAITTQTGNINSECGPSSQVELLGLEWNPLSSQQGGGYSTVISYADVQNGSTYSLVRYDCESGPSNTAYTTTIISYDIQQPCTATVTSNCQSYATVYINSVLQASPIAWTNTTGISKVEFALDEPSTTGASLAADTYSYTLAGVPADSVPVVAAGGSAFTPATTAGCNFASPGTGTYASDLCLVDFSGLTGNNLLAAEQGCLETSVNLPGGSLMYFCIGITGTVVQPFALPTWQNAFLGNSCSGSTSCSTGLPFYTGISGKPALYQTAGGTTVITISNITVHNAQGVPATGWEVVGADAESTDANESITFQSTTPLTIMSNGESYDVPGDVVGNACNSGAGLTESANSLSVTCVGATTATVKTGTTMVWAPASTTSVPLTFTTTLVGSGLEAMAFGVLLS